MIFPALARTVSVREQGFTEGWFKNMIKIQNGQKWKKWRNAIG